MAKKHNSGLGRSILKFILIIPAIFNLVDILVTLAKNEAATIRRKMVFLLMMALFSFVLLASVWICASALLISYLLSLQLSLEISIMFVLILNVLLFLITCLILSLVKVDPSMPETRKVIKDLVSH